MSDRRGAYDRARYETAQIGDGWLPDPVALHSQIFKGATVHEPTPSRFNRDPLGGLAGEVASDLYFAVSGQRPKTIRAYHDDDALLLLVRFDPAELADGTTLETAFMA